MTVSRDDLSKTERNELTVMEEIEKKRKKKWIESNERIQIKHIESININKSCDN